MGTLDVERSSALFLLVPRTLFHRMAFGTFRGARLGMEVNSHQGQALSHLAASREDASTSVRIQKDDFAKAAAVRSINMVQADIP